MNRLLISALRHAPTRIVVGEVRTGIVLMTWFKACSTGHPCGITTIHANSAEEVLPRIQGLAGEVSVTDQIAIITSCLDLVLFVERGTGSARLPAGILLTRFPWRPDMLNVTNRTILLAVLLLLVFICQADPSIAEVDNPIVDDAQPFQKFVGWITGGFATFLAIILVLAAGFMLAAGSDFSGFARRIPTMLLGLGFILLATNFITFLFGVSGAVLTSHEIATIQTPALIQPAEEGREEIAPGHSPTPGEIAHVR